MSTPSKTGPRRPIKTSLGTGQLHARPRARQSISAGQVRGLNTELAEQTSLQGVQEATCPASQDELLQRLQRGHDEREELLVRVEDKDKQLARLQGEVFDLKGVLAVARKREEDALASQLRLETDLIARDAQILELQEGIKKLEKLLQAAERRAMAATRDSEAENRALVEKVERLVAAASSVPPKSYVQASSPSSDNEAALRAAEEGIALLRAQQTRNLAQTNALRNDLAASAARIAELEEETHSWELLMRERTLDGTFLPQSLFGEAAQEGKQRLAAEGERGVLDHLDESLEIASHDPAEDLTSQTAREATARGHSFSAGGASLASELERAEMCPEERHTGDDGEAIRAELKQLRETNKALTLYCSKIIDRIILQDGFEHILSVDYKTRRAVPKSRPSLMEISTGQQSRVSAVSAPSAEFSAEADRKARPLSMMSRAFSLSNTTAVTATQAEPPVAKAPSAATGDVMGTEEHLQADIKAQKRARRGFSLDFRSFGFGTGSASPSRSEEAGKALKPLTLAPQPAIVGAARKLEPHDEDEEDFRERHRLEASLKLMGIDRSTAQTPPPDVRGSSSTSEAQNTDTVSATASAERRSRRVSRLSSLLGTHKSGLNLDPEASVPSGSSHEDQAEQLLQDFDRRERKLADALARGGRGSDDDGSGTYTSPGPMQKRQSPFRRSQAAVRKESLPDSPSRS